MATASIVLDRVDIALADDPTTYVQAGSAGRSNDIEQNGSFRPNAAGGMKLITTEGGRHTVGLTLKALFPAEVDAVLAMRGKVILLRDTYGRRVYGGFLAASVFDLPLTGEANDTLRTDVTIVVTEVTFNEEV